MPKDDYFYYNIELKEFARKLRNNSTLAEILVWEKLLKQKQLRGYQFLRQRPIDHYIVDFFCKKLKLVNGYYHKFKRKEDIKRDIRLRELGFAIIHSQNEEILNDILNVQRTLESYIDDFER